MNNILQCPICKSSLQVEGKTYRCQNNHSFDCAKSGYVNLLMSQTSKHKQHGDSKAMLVQRRNFLNEGYYEPLLRALKTIQKDLQFEGIGLDMGCGEGYYTHGLNEHMPTIGVDISKEAVDLAARAYSGTWVVASTFQLPIINEAVDVCWSLFAPYQIDEVYRVLNKGGYFIHVYPLENHLMELKASIYDTVTKNDVAQVNDARFAPVFSQEVSYTIDVDRSADIEALFHMTPYSQRTSAAGIEKMKALKTLHVQCAFGIQVYQKEAYYG